MKNFLFMALMMSYLCACSQSHDIAGEYEKISKSGSVQYLLKLHPNGTFHFDSYSIRQIEGNMRIKGNLPAEPSSSKTKITIPTGAGGKQIHLILETKDNNPTTSLLDYRRIVIDVDKQR